MFQPIKRLKKFFGIYPDILVIKPSAMTLEQATQLGKETGKIVVYSEEADAVKSVKSPEKIKGDGKAVFFGEGTHEEFLEQEKEDKGFKGIFGL